MKKTLTVMIMDPPYESGSTATALRLIDAAIRKGHNVNVFAFEGAVGLALAGQKAHANPVHGTSVAEENHPTTKAFVASLFEVAAERGVTLDWANCGFCVDERGAEPWIEGPRRGGAGDMAKFVPASDQTVVIPTK